jgi:hypothetical protein
VSGERQDHPNKAKFLYYCHSGRRPQNFCKQATSIDLVDSGGNSNDDEYDAFNDNERTMNTADCNIQHCQIRSLAVD